MSIRFNTMSAEPYFGSALSADQGHHRFKFFPSVISKVRNAVGRDQLDILEIGSWAGASLIAWAKACEKRCQLFSIDSWRPYLGTENIHHAKMTQAANGGMFASRLKVCLTQHQEDIFELFVHNLYVANILDLVTIFEGKSEFVLYEFGTDEMFDLIFIDGDHTFNSVFWDIIRSMPLVKSGGILCGDDLEKQHHEVCNLSGYKTSAEFVRLEDGSGYHPGVTRAVHEIFGPVSCYDGLWMQQKLNGRWEDVTL